MQPGQIVQPNSQDKDVPADKQPNLPEVIRPQRTLTQEHSKNLEMSSKSGSFASPVLKQDTVNQSNTESKESEAKEQSTTSSESRILESTDKKASSLQKDLTPRPQIPIKADKASPVSVDSPKTDVDQLSAQPVTNLATEPPVESNNNFVETNPITKSAISAQADSTVAEVASNEPIDRTPLVSWQASEYTQHQHSSLWYVGMSGATAAFILLLIFLPGGFGFQEWLSALVILLMIVAIVVYSHKSPRMLDYALTPTDIMVGSKYYSYSKFHSFGVLNYNGQVSVELDPLRRFMPRISLPVNEQTIQQVVDILAPHLSRNERKPDPIDRLTHYLKF